MKYCSHCGKELLDEAVICPGCGCACAVNAAYQTPAANDSLVSTLANRVQINGVIWIIVGSLQILFALFVNWYVIIVGILNFISGIQDMSYSTKVKSHPVGIVKKFQPLAWPIVVLLYNLIFGGIIGVAGSIYYLAAVRNLVLTNEHAFKEIEQQYTAKH